MTIPVLTRLKEDSAQDSPGELVFRADATAEIGTGHVMRCLALAQGWQDRGRATRFLCASIPRRLEEALVAQGFPVTHLPVSPGGPPDADAIVEQAKTSDWVVVDGDAFSAEYLLRLKAGHARIMLIDDYGQRKNLSANVILNQNLNANAQLYPSTIAGTQLLLGTKYLLLRREFRARSQRTDFPTVARHILVTLGGTDPDNLSMRIANAARLEPGKFLVTIATTSANPYLAQLQEFCGGMPSPATLLVDAPNMADVMANSDIAIIASGGTLWELLYLGCPVLSYSRNQAQARLLEDLALSGAVADMGAAQAFDGTALVSRIEELASSPLKRQSMSDAGARIVDGRGVDRVIEHLLQA